jgi:hypothetical protein
MAIAKPCMGPVLGIKCPADFKANEVNKTLPPPGRVNHALFGPGQTGTPCSRIDFRQEGFVGPSPMRYTGWEFRGDERGWGPDNRRRPEKEKCCVRPASLRRFG